MGVGEDPLLGFGDPEAAALAVVMRLVGIVGAGVEVETEAGPWNSFEESLGVIGGFGIRALVVVVEAVATIRRSVRGGGGRGSSAWR